MNKQKHWKGESLTIHQKNTLFYFSFFCFQGCKVDKRCCTHPCSSWWHRSVLVVRDILWASPGCHSGEHEGCRNPPPPPARVSAAWRRPDSVLAAAGPVCLTPSFYRGGEGKRLHYAVQFYPPFGRWFILRYGHTLDYAMIGKRF